MNTANDPMLAAAIKAAVATELHALQGQVQQLANKLGKPSNPEDTNALDHKIQTALDTFHAGQKDLDEKIAQLKSDSDESKRRLQELASSMTAPPARPAGPGQNAEKILRDSKVTEWLSGHTMGYTPKTKIPSLLTAEGIRTFAATPDTVGIGDLGGMIVPAYDPTFRPRPLPARPFASYCPRIPVGSNSYIYPRETLDSAHSGIRTTNVNAQDADDVALTLTDIAGIVVGGVILISHGGVLYPAVVSAIDTGTKVVTVSWAWGHAIDAGDIVVAQEFGTVAESAQKPYTGFKSDPVTATLRMLPIMTKVTREADILTGIRQTLGTKMPQIFERDLSFLILMGDGTVPGLLTWSGAQTNTWSAGPGATAGDSRADAVLRTWARCWTPGPYRAWMDRQAWLSLMLAKGASEKGYLMSKFGPLTVGISPDGSDAMLEMLAVSFDDTLGRPASASWATVTRNCIVIDHAEASQILHNPASAAFDVGTVNDDFELNQFRLRYEEMVGQAIRYPEAYCVTEFDSAPA